MTDDVNLNFGVDFDSAGAAKAQQELQRLEKAQLEVSRSFAKGELSADEADQQLKKYDKQIRIVSKNLKILTREQDAAAKSQAKAARAAESDRKERRGRVADGAGAGSSGQAAVRDAVGVLGGSAGEAIGPLLEMGEGITDLVEVGAGALGPAGAIVGLAVAGMAAFANHIAAGFEEANAIAASRLQTTEDIAFGIADGTLSLEAAESSLADVRTRLDTATKLVGEAEEDRAIKFDERVAELGGGAFGDLITRVEESLGSQSALDEAIERRKGIVVEATGAEQAYADAIDSGSLSREKDLEKEKKSREDAKKASGDSTDSIKKAAAASKDFSAAVDDSANSVTSAVAKIGAAAKSVERQSGELKRGGISGRSGKGVGGTTFSLGGGRKKSSKSAAPDGSQAIKDAESVQKGIADARQKAREDEFKLIQDFNDETAKENRQAKDEIRKINRDAQQEEADGERNRDFLAIARARESRKEQIDELEIQRGIERREREQALSKRQQEITKQLQAFESGERAKLKAQNAAQQQSLAMSGNFWNTFVSQQRAALSQLGGGGRRGNTDKRMRQLTARQGFGT